MLKSSSTAMPWQLGRDCRHASYSGCMQRAKMNAASGSPCRMPSADFRVARSWSRSKTSSGDETEYAQWNSRQIGSVSGEASSLSQAACRHSRLKGVEEVAGEKNGGGATGSRLAQDGASEVRSSLRSTRALH